MAFPPRFLDELRQRVSLAEVVGRRVKLTRRGREYIGLCPFHKEKTPSFSVVEDKGFFHCFGCGAHGDVIGLVMQTESLSFPEAVEQLARQAGLEVPRETREERERAARQATLQAAVDAAGAFFEKMLHGPEGREARLYLERRSLDEDTIRRFRLGYAPDGREHLKRALGQQFPEPLLIEAGLLRKPEGGGETYDYFRHRVIFPIGDRRGRSIAFGGRVVDDGQPKYLNSPDTPLFQKGNVLYGWAQARQAAAGKPSAIVVEGYMDVIAMHRAGFDTAVAPLGTALTETQLGELWRLAPEPIVCFDGDAAGQRAADRAVGLALPRLRPGFSLRFAKLPEGEDPDTLIQRQGVDGMKGILQAARSLELMIWTKETVDPIRTPEQRAALKIRLREWARRIADNTVQRQYQKLLDDRFNETFRRPWVGPDRVHSRQGRLQPIRPGHPAWVPESAPRADPGLLVRRREEVLLALLINHPFLLNEVEDELAQIKFASRDLDRLCGAILKGHQVQPDLDAEALRLHLRNDGFAKTVDAVLSAQVLNHAAFARQDADPEAARLGWADTRGRFEKRRLGAQIRDAERDLAGDMSVENWTRMQPLLEHEDDDDGTA